MRPREIRRLIIHCAATKPQADIGASEIRRWHVEGRRWSDIGYHGVIRRNGALEAGRPIHRIGAHVLGQNRDSIGLCLVGGYGSSADDEFEANFTPYQRVTLSGLIRAAQGFGLSVHGHNEFAAKACPGFRVDAFLRSLSEEA